MQLRAQYSTIWDQRIPCQLYIGIIEIPTPYMIPARVLPINTDRSETGAVRNLSKVWFARSMGITTGPIEEEAKKSVWAISMGICCANGDVSTDAKRKKKCKRKEYSKHKCRRLGIIGKHVLGGNSPCYTNFSHKMTEEDPFTGSLFPSSSFIICF